VKGNPKRTSSLIGAPWQKLNMMQRMSFVADNGNQALVSTR